MPKPIYTFLRGKQLIHAKADLRYTPQKYNIFFILQVFLEQIQQSIATPDNGDQEAKMTELAQMYSEKRPISVIPK